MFQKKHELWLKLFFTALAFPPGKKQETLFDFATIQFRHLQWLGQKRLKEGGDFDWNRENIVLKATMSDELLKPIIDDFDKLGYGDDALDRRIMNDDSYIKGVLQEWLEDIPILIEAFNKKMEYKNLDRASRDALIRFLLEESYKEYELIVTYTYAKIHSSDAFLVKIFQDLIDESLFHLKSFGLLEAKLGLLSIPRVVMEEVYKFEDLKKFLEDGIKEEEAAKEECLKLSQGVKDKELQAFFDFINNQESYHIELMREAVEHLEKR